MDISKIIEEHKKAVVFFSRRSCVYCEHLVNDLKSYKIPFTKIIIEKEDVDSTYALVAKTEHKTFPQIFIGGEFIGGYDAFVKHVCTRKLITLLENVGIVVDLDDF